MEILVNEPYDDGPGGQGQYTHKIYHVGSHLPGNSVLQLCMIVRIFFLYGTVKSQNLHRNFLLTCLTQPLLMYHIRRLTVLFCNSHVAFGCRS